MNRNPLGTIDESGLSDAPSNPSLENSEASSNDLEIRPTNSHLPDTRHDIDHGEEFTYRESDEVSESSRNEEFRYTVSPVEPSQPESSSAVTKHHAVLPSPAQLEAVTAVASSGDLHSLQVLFQTTLSRGETEAFSLANTATPRSGLTPLHAATSRGHISVVQWLVEHCGALVDLEDKEGETALHKAALCGHLDIIIYLCSLPTGKADVHARDTDGWTPLHNACAKGYLDIVQWLCEKGGAADTPPSSHGTSEQSSRGVDQRSTGGWTPLMNAASKGHLTVVLYLLTKQSANPLLRNNWGETAYDAAAAVFEVWICEVLQRAEADRWRDSPKPYNPLAVHTTIPLILHENQRLDNRLKTLAVSSGRPKFSASGLGRGGRRSPFELRLLPGSEDQGKQYIKAWRSDVQLPLTENPFRLPVPTTNKELHIREGTERSHFWLSDWILDTTHPKVDVHEGWQYARSFDDPDDQWSAEMPPALERVMSGSGVFSTGFSVPSSSHHGLDYPGYAPAAGTQLHWVRRRRWVRVMRRRLDIPPLPFVELDGSMYQVSGKGALVPFVQDDRYAFEPDGGQELRSMPQSFLPFTQDYVSRARYLAGSGHDNDLDSVLNSATAADIRKSIAKLERAVLELRAGMLGDEDLDRKTQAEVLLNAYSRELGRRRLAARAQGVYDIEDQEAQESEDYDSDGSFHYPMSPTSTAPSVRSHSTGHSLGPSGSGPSTDLTPHLSQAPEFRVPTHEAPQKFSPQRTPTPHSMHAQWERDEAVSDCRSCNRKFTFLFRKHHCRKCGRIFCDRCSSHRSMLDPADVVHDPSTADGSSSTSLHRVCVSCFDMTSAGVPGRFHGLRTASMEQIFVDQRRLAAPNTQRGDTNSQISDLADCPVCGQNLGELGPAEMQETHVKTCLESRGNSTTQQAGKYLVYRLPGESALIGIECVICLEEFLEGSLVARLSCLCTFHNVCLSAWLQRRGRCCPIHARDT